jgi:hypothetical protein
MSRKVLEALVGASLLVPTLAGCFSGGGGGSDSQSASLSMTLADPSNPAPSAFRFTLTGISLIGADDSETRLFPPAYDPFATTPVAHESFGGTERILGEYTVAPGTYRAVRFQYEDAEAGDSSDPRPIVPALADVEMNFAQPLAIASGEHQNVRLVFDLEHSLSRAGQAYLLDPLVFAEVEAPSTEPALSEFLGKVTAWDAVARTLDLRLLHAGDGSTAPVEYGTVVADIPPTAVLSPAGGEPFVAASASWLDQFLGANPQDQWLEVLGFLTAEGHVRVQSADVRVQNPPPVHVQVEGVIAAMGSDDSGIDLVDVAVTSVESGRAPIVDAHPGTLRFAFSPSTPPSTHVNWTGAPLAPSSLFPGIGVEFQGYASDVHSAFAGEGSEPGHVPAPQPFVVTNIQVRPVTLTGTLAGLSTSPNTFGIVDVDRIAGLSASTYPHQVAVALYDPHAITSDATVPMPASALQAGQELQLTGYFTDANGSTFGTTHAGSGSSGAPASGSNGSHTGGIAGGTPQHLQDDGLPIFVAINVSVRGVEFEGETISAIDPVTQSFHLQGDGSDFGYPDPTTIRIQTRPDTRIVTESTAGRQVGVAASAFFQSLPFAHVVSVRGYLDRSVDPPVLTASYLRAELP